MTAGEPRRFPLALPAGDGFVLGVEVEGRLHGRVDLVVYSLVTRDLRR